MSLDKTLSDFKIFWQYPVITEKSFANQSKYIKNYIAVPWATIIDKNYPFQLMYNFIRPHIKTVNNITCCQHIYFRKLIKLFCALDIKMVYTPHKIIGEDKINGITIKPCPLYAVNIEDDKRNMLFKGKTKKYYLKLKRKYLYSFQGAYNPAHYLTDIRKRIFIMKHNEDVYIKNIGGWHFDQIVYNPKQNNKGELNIDQTHLKNKEDYNELLLKSRYSLCPSGSGPNSIRFWESLAVGSIPILLADTLDLPRHKLWEKSIIRVKEEDLEKIPELLNKIDEDEEKMRRENCIKIYNYFKNNYRN